MLCDLESMAFLDLYISAGRGSRLTQINPNNLDMVSPVVNRLLIIKLKNLMDKYGIPFFEVDRLTSGLYNMVVNSTSIIMERATIMPQVSDTSQMHHLDPS